MDVYSLLTKRPSKPTISTINNSTNCNSNSSNSSNSTNINTSSNTNINTNVTIQSNTITNYNSKNNDQQSLQKEKDLQLQNQQPCLVIGHNSSSNNKSNQIHNQNKLNNIHQRILKKSHWKSDCEFLSCYSCSLPFTLFTRRRHHCRICGFVFCFECCFKFLWLDNETALPISQSSNFNDSDDSNVFEKRNIRDQHGPNCTRALVCLHCHDRYTLQKPTNITISSRNNPSNQPSVSLVSPCINHNNQQTISSSIKHNNQQTSSASSVNQQGPQEERGKFKKRSMQPLLSIITTPVSAGSLSVSTAPVMNRHSHKNATNTTAPGTYGSVLSSTVPTDWQWSTF